MAPQFFGTIVEHLQSENILNGKGFERVIIEKPFGNDYDSAVALNNEIRTVFPEDDIFRIDHYLGKEMVQNIAAVRFANSLFENMWNSKYISNVQITFAESIGVEDRGGYYDKSGALKDMIQNHVLQVISLLAMEPPAEYTEKDIRVEKVKALRAIRKITEEDALANFVPGQYEASTFNDKEYVGYNQEPSVDPNTLTETFAAGKFLIDNFRWQGVPFYVRTGKRLTEKSTRINIVFKDTPQNIFPAEDKTNGIAPNVLTLYIQPTEGFSLIVNGKEAGQGFNLEPMKLDFRHDSEYLGNSPEAYERLMLDALMGDGTNFSHWDELSLTWKLTDAIRHAWDKNITEIPQYKVGTMGPKEAFDLLAKDGHQWVFDPTIWYKERGKLSE
jgi:glucose-6-phosphate 1-dehydrogenase